MHRHTLTWLAIFAVIALMFVRLPQMVAVQDTVTHTYGALVEVDSLARQRYVEPVDSDRLVRGAIRGLLRELDPYSGYIAPEELPSFERRNHGEYIGIGIEVGVRDGWLTVIAPIEGSPAMRAGVQAGDRILAIDGRDTKGLSVFDVEDLVVGEPGTSVRLRVLHAGEEDAATVEVMRGPVTLRTVRGFARTGSGEWDYWIDRGRRIAYIRISGFLENTLREFDEAFRTLAAEGVRGLVIDLRFNPGGLMPQAVGIVDRFVDRGVIVSTVNRREAVRQYLASAAGTNRNVKLVVLVNGESASASEIVSGSLQDHGRAIVMGERTFGKGSVQNLIRLKESAGAIKLTTAYYRLPKGRIVHRTRQNAATDEWGVIPDVKVALTREEKAAVRAARRRLDNGKGSGGALPMDRQLDAAVKTLREALSTRANLSLGHTEDRRLRLVHALP